MRRLLVLCMLLVLPAAADDAQVMRDYGAWVLANAPPAIKRGTKIEKARYAFVQYCSILARHQVPVNKSLSGRLLQAVRLEPGRWTCSHHANMLSAMFEGMKLGAKGDSLYVAADSKAWLATPNSDHGALTLRDEQGDFYVFDPWMLAVNAYANQALYSGSENSEWNGMPLGVWTDRMKAAGYVQFSVNHGQTWYESANAAVVAGNYELQPHQRGALPGRFHTKGKYLGWIVWEDGTQTRLNMVLEEEAVIVTYPGQIRGDYLSPGNFEWSDDNGYRYHGTADGTSLKGVVEAFRQENWVQVGSFSAFLQEP